MKKKKDSEPDDDKKKLLELESLSNNSQEGIQLRSAAELLGEAGETLAEAAEQEKKQGRSVA